MKKEKITLKEIARLASVSPTTASLILNGKGQRMSQETIDRVNKVVEQYHYVPDFYAQRMTTKEAKMIGVILPDLTDFFFAKLLQGIERAAAKEGYSILLMHSHHSKEKEEEALQTMISRSVDGIILATPYLVDGELFNQVKKICPIILIDNRNNPRKEAIIYVDEQKGMADMVHYLYECGHRHIAFLKEDQCYYQLNYRFQGFKETMEQLGIFNEQLIVETPLSVAGGYIGTKKLLQKKTPFTAVICANDHLAIGAYRSLFEEGKQIPEDISIVGFDNIDIAAYLTPALTTVNQPIEALGTSAINHLIEKIQHPESPIANEELKTTLCIRDSVIKRKSH